MTVTADHVIHRTRGIGDELMVTSPKDCSGRGPSVAVAFGSSEATTKDGASAPQIANAAILRLVA